VTSLDQSVRARAASLVLGLCALAVTGLTASDTVRAQPSPTAPPSQQQVQDVADAAAEALVAGRGDEALRLLNQVIASNTQIPGVRARAHYHRGIIYQQRGQFNEAASEYTTALWLDGLPDVIRARAHYNRGTTLDNLGELARAREDFDAAVALAPDMSAAYNNRGNVLRRMGKFDAAIADYDTSIALGNPLPHLPYYGRGIAREELGNIAGARADLQKAASLAPDFALAADALAALPEADAAAALPEVEAGAKAKAEPVAVAAAQPATPPTEPPVPPAHTPSSVAGDDAWTTTILPADSRKVLTLDEISASDIGAPAIAPSTPNRADETQVASAGYPLPQAITPADNIGASSPRTVAVPADAKPSFAVSRTTTSHAGPQPKPAAHKPAPSARPASAKSKARFTVQLASLRSEGEAQAAWADAQRRLGRTLQDHGHVIQRADVPGKGIYYRLRVGPLEGKKAAVSLCTTLKAQGQDCYVAPI